MSVVCLALGPNPVDFSVREQTTCADSRPHCNQQSVNRCCSPGAVLEVHTAEGP